METANQKDSDMITASTINEITPEIAAILNGWNEPIVLTNGTVQVTLTEHFTGVRATAEGWNQTFSGARVAAQAVAAYMKGA